MKGNLIFVTGPFGAPVLQRAATLALKKDLPLICLDDEIQKAEGRSVLHICMIMGEHEYRNKEYRALTEVIKLYGSCDKPQPDSGSTFCGAVVACGDGVLLDEMSRAIILNHNLVIEGFDLTEEELFEKALCIKDPCHAFMHDKNKANIRKAFSDLSTRQKAFFKEYI